MLALVDTTHPHQSDVISFGKLSWSTSPVTNLADGEPHHRNHNQRAYDVLDDKIRCQGELAMLLASAAFLCRPTRGQFAKANAWESAWICAPTAPPADTELDSYLLGATDVAFEVFFGAAYLGVQFPNHIDAGEFARQLLDSFADATSAESYIANLRRVSGLGLPFNQISSAALGAVNAWVSVGPYDMPSSALFDIDSLWNDFSEAPVAANTTHPKGLEAVFAGDVDHWVSLPVSQPAPPYRLSREALREAAQCLVGFTNQ